MKYDRQNLRVAALTIPLPIVWRNQYDYAEDAKVRALSDIEPGGPSMTVQAPAAETDINEIVRRFGIGEIALPPEPDPSAYGDLTDVPDLRAVLEIARDAQDRFNQLPVRLRSRFDNDPSQLWDFVNDPANADEAVEIGLLVKPPAPPVVTPAPAPVEAPKPEETAGKPGSKTDTK